MTTSQQDLIQQKAADPSRSVHLSASAGSGKTKSLVDRYLALLGSGKIEIDQSVAITFTEKAAAEMKQRVMAALTEAARQAPASGSAAEAVFKKIIRGRQDLRISTIHSFCMNLLKRYPLEAGLPPDFGVLDSRDQAAKIQRAIADTLEEADRSPDLFDPLRHYAVDALEARLSFLLSRRSQLKRLEVDAGGPEDLVKKVRLGAGIAAAESEATGLVKNSIWRLIFEQMERILKTQGDNYYASGGPAHLALAKAKDALTAFTASEALLPVYFTAEGQPRKLLKIPKKTFIGSAKERVAYEAAFPQVLELLGQLRNACLRARAGAEVVSFIRLYLLAEGRYRDSKLREGLLDFDDLEISAYGLLQNPASLDILYWLDRKIIHVLVDEFQDTSDIQWGILDKLTEEIFSGQGADKPMRPTLFVVGDEKQSIYRFREANYQLLRSVQKKMDERLPGTAREILTLSMNYRSTPQIIETVNEVFAKLWNEDYTPSDPDRKEHSGSVRLIELSPASGENAPSGLSPEAEVLAREIKTLIREGTTVYERAPGSRLQGNDNTRKAGWTKRTAEYGDCAVLIQSRTRLKDYEAALQHEGIPYRVVGGIGFYEEDEIQAIMNILFFLWNRRDWLSLAAALKSRLFGFTDKDIFDLRSDGEDLFEALKRRDLFVWELFHSWSSLSGMMPLARLIHRIIGDTGAYVRFGKSRNAQAIFNLDKLLDTANDFDRRGYTTLQDFVEWVKNVRRTEEREATADVNLPEFQGAVVITTVHKAKGLEFPVVFLPGMNQSPRSITIGPEAIIRVSEDGARMAIKNADNPAYQEMWDREKDELKREHQRLLYVAMTRARDHLIMIGALNSGKTPVKQNTWLGFLHETMPQPLFEKPTLTETGLTRYSYPLPAPGQTVKNAAEEKEARPVAQQGERFAIDVVMRDIAPAPSHDSLEWKKVTDFVSEPSGEKLVAAVMGTDASPVSPLLRGTVLHRCLESFAKTGEYDIGKIVREYPEIHSLQTEARDRFMNNAASVLQAALGNKDLAWVFDRQPGAYTELPFLYKKGRDIISGVIDRLVIREGKGFVIDYKAIAIDHDEILQAWQKHYRPQLGIYCEAVKELFKLESVEGYLLFLDSGRLELTTRL